MNTPKIQAFAITQEGATTHWKATGYIDGVGWLGACGTTLMTAIEAFAGVGSPVGCSARGAPMKRRYERTTDVDEIVVLIPETPEGIEGQDTSAKRAGGPP